jgi:hypothetical protein
VFKLVSIYKPLFERRTKAMWSAIALVKHPAKIHTLVSFFHTYIFYDKA